MQKIHYKVTTRGSFSLCGYYGPNGRESAQYNTKQTTLAHAETKLFVFDTLEHAKQFADSANRIYKCTATNVRKPVSIKCDSIQSIKLYWDTINKARKQKKSITKALLQTKYFYEDDKWPKGTLWADSVTILEEVN